LCQSTLRVAKIIFLYFILLFTVQNTKLLKIFTAIICVFTFMLLQTPQTLAIGVKPLRTVLEKAINPGEKAETTLTIINSDSIPISVESNIECYAKNDEDGFPAEALPIDDKRCMSNWISFDPKQPYEIPPNSEQKINAIITVPADALPGSYSAAITPTPALDQNQNGVQVNTRVASLILLEVAGEKIVQATVENFNLKNNTIYGDKPLTITTDFQNTGNVHLQPTGDITILDQQTKKQITKICTYIDPQTKEEIVADAIPINLAGSYVLPDSPRSFISEWNTNLKQGKFTANLTLKYANNQPEITKTFDFEIKEDLTIDDFQAILNPESINFNLVITNNGSVQENLIGEVEIKNAFNSVIANPQIPEIIKKITQEDGTEINSKYLEPNTTTTIEIPWMEEPLPEGKYTVTLKAKYGLFDTEISKKITINNLPSANWLLYSCFGGGVLLILIIVVVFLKKKKNGQNNNQNNKMDVDAQE
jgi:hypothetical protein